MTQPTFSGPNAFSQSQGIYFDPDRKIGKDRFGALAGHHDGRIVVCHPQMFKSFSNQEQAVAKSGISKMTSSFEKKDYVVQLGNERVCYHPLHIVPHCLNNATWVSCIRRSTSMHETKSCEDEYRLVAFTCCSPFNSGNDAQSTKKWMSFHSWSFDQLRPGPIAKLNDKLMVVDISSKSLNYLHVPQCTDADGNCEVVQPKLTRVTKPDASRQLLGITSYKSHAYMWTDQALYSFAFKEDVIWDSSTLDTNCTGSVMV